MGDPCADFSNVYSHFGQNTHCGVTPMTAPRSALLIAWAKAWRRGLVSYDEVIDHTIGDDEPHDVIGLPGEVHPVGLATALAALSRTDPDGLRLVLPSAGDPRGLP